MQSNESPLYLLARVLCFGDTSSTDAFNPRLFTNIAPCEFIARAPPVLVPAKASEVLPFLSNLTTSLLSFCAIRRPPSLVAMIPSALLPSTSQISFHFCPAATTPGISVTVYSLGPGAAASGRGPRAGPRAPLAGGGT